MSRIDLSPDASQVLSLAQTLTALVATTKAGLPPLPMTWLNGALQERLKLDEERPWLRFR